MGAGEQSKRRDSREDKTLQLASGREEGISPGRAGMRGFYFHNQRTLFQRWRGLEIYSIKNWKVPGQSLSFRR